MKNYPCIRSVILAGLVTFALTSVQAQVLISNLGNTPSPVANVGYIGDETKVVAQGFTTGSDTNGYSVTSMTIDIRDSFTAASSGLTMEIYTDVSGSPGALLNSFSGSDPATIGPITHTSGGISLAANTPYFLVLRANQTPSNLYYGLDGTNNHQTFTSGFGWTIGESSTSRIFTSTNGGAWTNYGTNYALLIEVGGSAVPEPSSYTAILAGLALASTMVVRRRKRDRAIGIDLE